ncbi:MAG: hypothetical protein WC947_09040, partial [Elusimicrobiota bacterium]
GNIQTELDSVELDTGTLRTDLTAETNNRISADNEIKISTGALRNEVITSTASLVLVDRNLATSTGTLDTNKLDKSSATVTYVFKSGDTLGGDLNSAYKIIGSTIGNTNTKLYGDGSSLTGTSAVDTACRISTGNIQTELDSVELDTGTLRTDLTAETNNRISADNEIKISTGALRNEVITSTASLVLVDRNLATSTGTLDTNKLDKSSATATYVFKSGDTLGGDLNSAYKIIGSTIGNTNSKLYGDGSSLTGTSAVDTACRISTGNIQTELDSVELDTGTLRTDLTAETNNRISADNEIKISTGALRNEVITSTASLVLVDRNLATSTGTLDTNKLDKSSATVTYVFRSGDTLTGDLNSAYKIIGSTLGNTNSKLYGDGSSLTQLPVRQFYNVTVSTSVKGWIGTATTTSGVATFYPTNDGTSGGTALFTNVTSVQATAQANASTAITVPLASVKAISADKKTVTVNVVIGTTAVVSGPTLAFAPDGTVVYLTVFGN